MFFPPATPWACRYQQRLPHCQSMRGFTLVEMVVVMVLVGIIAAVGINRFFDNKGFDAVAYTDRIVGMLRYGQKLAIAQNRQVFVDLNGNRIGLCFDAACTGANQIVSISGNNSRSASTLNQCGNQTWECEGLPPGLSYSVSPTLTSFYFDPLGKPFLASDVFPSATTTFATVTVRITGDGSNHDVVVEQETGYVH